jgi:hypothetical protein
MAINAKIDSLPTRALELGGMTTLETIARQSRSPGGRPTIPSVARHNKFSRSTNDIVAGLEFAGFVEADYVLYRVGQLRMTSAGWAQVGGRPEW